MNKCIQPHQDPLGRWLTKLRQYRCLNCGNVFVGSGPKLFISCPACGKGKLADTGVRIYR